MWHNATKINETSTELRKMKKKNEKLKAERVEKQHSIKKMETEKENTAAAEVRNTS